MNSTEDNTDSHMNNLEHENKGAKNAKLVCVGGMVYICMAVGQVAVDISR